MRLSTKEKAKRDGLCDGLLGREPQSMHYKWNSISYLAAYLEGSEYRKKHNITLFVPKERYCHGNACV